MGMRVCAESECLSCHAKIIEDLKSVYALTFPCQVDLAKQTVFCSEIVNDWFGKPLLWALENPQQVEIKISREVFTPHQQVVILNCIDFLYGHSLLRLLNAQKHLECHSQYGLILIIQSSLKWIVPDGVAEVWTVDIPFKKGKCYHPSFNEFVQKELERFGKVYISKASPHPKYFNIENFTKIPKHDFSSEELKITFIWREDRIWFNLLLTRIFRKLKLSRLSLFFQKQRILSLFKGLKASLPSAKFAVAGLGTTTQFPKWIEDFRISAFDEESERKTCEIYSLSRLVIGVHGSNMLLPSAHAGMTIDLMLNGKENRWSNFAQDILYHEQDARLAAFRYQYVSFEVSMNELIRIASNMILKYSEFKQMMTQQVQG